ncbi:hypothetical protein [Haladaptatus cibarius]|uniref:hypothetical protein n=1 Tax=Haladaptatus cibarius TaxID=453847 RepID=UPI0011848608|nr:hypothetical protein [Haladaptatus cibarius]
MNDDSSSVPSATSNTDALEVALAESRRTFDKTVSRLEEIDDKAMRSVRTAVLLAGFVASAIGVGGPSSISDFGVFPVLLVAIGVICLIISIVLGIGTYTITQYPSGIGSSHRTDVITGGYNKKEWLVDMINEYDEWISEINTEIRRNGGYLDVVQISLAFAVVCLLISSSMIVVKAAYDIPPLITLSMILLFVPAINYPKNLVSGRT